MDLASVLEYGKLKRGEQKQYERWLNIALRQNKQLVFKELTASLPYVKREAWLIKAAKFSNEQQLSE